MTSYSPPYPDKEPEPYYKLRQTTQQQYHCPKFQRRYVWDKRQYNYFWDDLMESMDSGSVDTTPIYMGALVFHYDSNSPGIHLIVDGQQRLTTINLLVCAIHKKAKEANWQEVMERATDMLTNYERDGLKNRYWPTDFDRDLYQACMKDCGMVTYGEDLDDLPPRVYEGGRKIRTAYEYFIEKLDKMLNPDVMETDYDKQQWIAKLLFKVIDEGLYFSPITISGSQYQVTEVFDRLNRKGTELSLMDLIRNEMFRRFGHDVNTEVATDLFENQWKPFEANLDKNQKAKDFFYPYSLIKNPNTTQARAFQDTRAFWSSLLGNNNENNDNNPSNEEAINYAQIILSDMTEYVSGFLALSSNISSGDRTDLEPFTELEPELSSLLRMNPLTRTSYSFLMNVLKQYESQRLSGEFVKKVLRLVESFLVRLSFAAREPTGTHAIFKTAYRSGQVDAQNLEHFIKNGIHSRTMQFSDDDTFKENIRKYELYPARLCKYIVLEYERSVNIDNNVLDTLIQGSNENSQLITIDHIMPQRRQGSWADEFTAAEHEKWLHTFANLVPLTGRANGIKSTRSFSEAQNILRNQTPFASTVKIYSDYSRWNVQALEHRTEQIIEWAVERWPRDQYLESE